MVRSLRASRRSFAAVATAAILGAALAGPAPAQWSVAVKGGGIGEDLTFTFEGTPGATYLDLLSFFEGPVCLPPKHTVGCIDVGLDLFQYSFLIPGLFGVLPGSGKTSITFGVPVDPAFDGLVLYDQLLHVDHGALTEKSNLYRLTFAYPDTFSRSLFDQVHDRYAATAAQLANGDVMLIGGDPTNLRGTERYTVGLEEFSDTALLQVARGGHSATRLADGRLLVVGGADSNGTTLKSAELYDPATNQWQLTGGLTTARALHSATLLPDGRVLVAGGSSDLSDATVSITSALSSTELYDPATGVFSAGPTLAHPHSLHAAVSLSNGSVLVVGGVSWFLFFGQRIPQITPTAQVYDASAGSLGGERSMATQRVGMATALLQDGTVMIAGGLTGDIVTQFHVDSFERFDPVAGQFLASPAKLTVARSLPAVAVLEDGSVLIAGGDTGSLTTPSPSAVAELFDPVLDQSVATASLLAARSRPVGFLLPDGTAGVFLGETGAVFAELFQH